MLYTITPVQDVFKRMDIIDYVVIMNFIKQESLQKVTRKVLTQYQRRKLMEAFETNPYPEGQEIRQLAESLKISECKIRRWYDYTRIYQSESKQIVVYRWVIAE